MFEMRFKKFILICWVIVPVEFAFAILSLISLVIQDGKYVMIS
jgi:hypothetical protein